MSKITRRETLARGGQAAAAAAVAMTAGIVPTPAKAARPDPLREGVQALVNEIRQDLSGSITTGTFWTLQETADRLEALPGIQPVANEIWERYWKPQLARQAGKESPVKEWPVLRRTAGRAI